MKFKVRRTSEWGDKKPCKEAKRITLENWHTRTCTELEFNDRFSHQEGLWQDRGKNHQITKEGYITRQMEDIKAWGVEFSSLSDLVAFAKEYGELVISVSSGDMVELEIYDDYRE